MPSPICLAFSTATDPSSTNNLYRSPKTPKDTSSPSPPGAVIASLISLILSLSSWILCCSSSSDLKKFGLFSSTNNKNSKNSLFILLKLALANSTKDATAKNPDAFLITLNDVANNTLAFLVNIAIVLYPANILVVTAIVVPRSLIFFKVSGPISSTKSAIAFLISMDLFSISLNTGSNFSPICF